MNTDFNEKPEWTLDIGKANLYAFLLIIPIFILFVIPYILLWGVPSLKAVTSRPLPVLFFLFSGIILHELLHGITWALFAKKKFRSIRFGFKWEYITPYCHCKEPLKMKHYLLGAVMPVLIMGIVPSVVALFTGKTGWLAYGVFFTWAAGGDIIAIYAMRKLKKNQYISDHPEKLGFIIEEEKTDEEK